jgi:hypothetical protein
MKEGRKKRRNEGKKEGRNKEHNLGTILDIRISLF